LKEKIVEWFIFSVLLGLLPIVFSLLRLLTRGDAPSILDLFSHGELLLPAAALSGAAVGNLFSENIRRSIGTLICGGGSVLILAVSSWYYSEVTSAIPGVYPLDVKFVAKVSLSFYLCAVVLGAYCRIISEITNK